MSETGRQKLNRLSRKINDGPLKFLKDKINTGGNIGTNSFKRLQSRDFEMNGKLYKEAAEERKNLRIKKWKKCPICGHNKGPMYTLCYECYIKKKQSA